MVLSLLAHVTPSILFSQDQQIQVEKNSLDSESLNNSSTIAERVSVLENADNSAEGSLSETENSGSISRQKTVALTPGSIFPSSS